MARPTRLYEAYVFDMDGTIYLGDHLLPGAARLIDELRRREIPVRFLSNNPTKDPDMYASKLCGLGRPTPVADIANTVVTTVRWLLAHRPGAVVFPIAEEPLCRALEAAGIEISEDPSRIDVVISSYDRHFDYRKLQIAFDAIWFHKRAEMIETNPDLFGPFPGGRGEPDCAAITAASEACTGTTKVATMGKPAAVMVTEALRGLDVTPENCLMVGDRLMTDIAMAVDAGMASGLVLTGDSTRAEAEALAESQQPTYIVDRIDELLPAYVWAEQGWDAS